MLAAYRIWRLLAEDSILDRPRRRLLRLGKDWKSDGDPVPSGYREGWAIFLTCPWCLGFWLSIGIYLLWVWFPGEVLIASTVLAVSTGVGLIRENLDSSEEEE